MNNNCHVCELLHEPKHQILETSKWTVGIGNNVAYFGRAYVTLRDHKGSLAELDRDEWDEFEVIVKRLEHAYNKLFDAVPLNWGCFMNNAFRGNESNPHVHWHIFPRYRNAPEFDGQTFDDPLYGEHYDPGAERLIDENTVEKLAATLKDYLDKN
jgi:diadenosine tetraphosphate (Ap4A) HIT family hydrolase